MALQISGTNVVDNGRNLANIESFDSTVKSIWDQVTTTTVSKTLVNREYCTVIAAGLTITLPAAPFAGSEVVISVGDFSTTTIGRNGSNIMGISDDIIIDTPNSTLNLIYVDATRGWRIS